MWDALNTAGDVSIYFIIGASSTILFVIRLILALLGADGGHHGDLDLGGHDGVGHDHHTDSTSAFKLFSLLSITAFFMGAGWMGLACRKDWGLSAPLSAMAAIGFGTFAMLLASGMSSMIRRLNHEPQIDIKTCIGATARVYLTIPSHGKGRGQVQISVQGRPRVLMASSTGSEIPAFAGVKIVAVESDNAVIVEPQA